MKTTALKTSIAATLLLLTLGGCAGLTPREANTIGGAAIGGVTGAVLTHGSALGTVGGAAVGGIIGNSIGR